MLSGLFHAPSLLLIIPIVYLVYRSFALQVERIQKEKQHSEELKSLQIGVIEALALAVEAKDTGSNEHLRRMLIYAEGVGREMGLKDDELKALQAAALLHDIGKLAVPDYILSKPGRLTPEEFDRLKVHPLVGAEIIERARFPYAVAPIVRAHHERWDGSGYPFGLHGEEIPVGARILAAVDTLDALASDRHYRRAMSMDRALVAVSCEAGKAFDPAVVAVLRRIHRDLEDKARDLRMDPSPLAHSLEKANQGAFPAGADGSAAHSSGSFLASITAARKEEQTLHDLLQTIGHSLDLKETMGQLQLKLEGLIPNDTAVLYALRGDGLQAVHVAGQNFKAFEDLRVRLGMGLSGGVAVTRKPTVNGRPGDDLIYSADPEAGSRLKSGLALPLEVGQELIGILTLYSDKPNAYTPEHLRPLLALAPKLAVWLENALKFHQAESMATNDYLTGLPNAGSLYLHLQNEICRCERQSSDLVLMLCDLDGFKKVNDTFGHLVGNKVLQLVAKGLKESCREYDFVARMGGDEFVVVLPGLPEDAIRSREDRFRQMVEEAGIEACGEEMLGLSVGEARFGRDGRTADELIHCADERMYENKVARKELKRHHTAHEWSPKDFLKNLSR
jgi:diguanylate cyclase (GGDEF)-like protein/putative nucleotidyltransferase with HDIG domain